MDQLNLNLLLGREENEKKLIECLNYFEENKKNMLTKRGLFIYGSPGTGKTIFVEKILKKLNYDVIKYDAGDVRNKTIVDQITKHNMSDKNVLSLMQKKIKKIAIIMDELDGMNSGDKGGINTLIKLIRPKKTKKQKKEDTTMIPIICIGNYHIDKKIKEMIKICETVELKNPTQSQIKNIINILMPKLEDELRENMVGFIQGDLRKLKSTFDIYKNQESILKNQIIQNMFQKKNYNEDVKDIIKKLLNDKHSLKQHTEIMNETDRTSVGLLYHENIIDVLEDLPKKDTIPFYKDILKNVSFADYIDRITFQKQIWIFNEMSSLVKTFYNNHLYHKKYDDKNIKFNPQNVRFTKVLTKYSTEYNNSLFIQNLCTQLNMDIKDMLSYFCYLKSKYQIDEIIELFENNNYEINKLDINRIYRFLDCIVPID
uniref:AAA+ ATPase domain-containing protein n=1 Tax=viral metagenome TaxID=1070528 RepID=A0A6C0JCE6_9ZZZZ